YPPNAYFRGDDVFWYFAGPSSDPAFVSITVGHRPVANGDFYTTEKGTPLVIDSPGVLANDTYGDGNSLTVSFFTQQTAHGDLWVGSNGGFTYVPDADYSGWDAFRYDVHDGYMYSIYTTVWIKVNAAPTAANDSYTAAQDTPLT